MKVDTMAASSAGRDVIMYHKRKAKFDFTLYHFFHSGVISLYLPKKLFTLAGSEGIHDMWTHSSIFFLHCLFDFIFYLYFFFVIQFRWSTYNHSITSTWIPYRLLFCQSSWWVLYTAEKLLMCLTTDIYLPNHIRDILFVFHFFLLLSPRQRSCEGI